MNINQAMRAAMWLHPAIGPRLCRRCFGCVCVTPSARIRARGERRLRSRGGRRVPGGPPGPAAGLSRQRPSPAASPAIASGPTRQQPPMSRAPSAAQAATRSALNAGLPHQARAAASQLSPLLG